jgi:hypothetical protein
MRPDLQDPSFFETYKPVFSYNQVIKDADPEELSGIGQLAGNAHILVTGFKSP